MNRPNLFLLPVLALGVASGASAQSSASHRIEQGTVNNGGHPPVVLSSASHQLTLGSIGDAITAGSPSGPSHRINGGLPSVYAPPGEVTNLRLVAGGSVSWNPESSAGSYNLYRGDLLDLPTTYGTKVQAALPGPTTSDSTTPSPGGCFFYLVTATNRLAEEGPKGFDSDGNPRP